MSSQTRTHSAIGVCHRQVCMQAAFAPKRSVVYPPSRPAEALSMLSTDTEHSPHLDGTAGTTTANLSYELCGLATNGTGGPGPNEDVIYRSSFVPARTWRRRADCSCFSRRSRSAGSQRRQAVGRPARRRPRRRRRRHAGTPRVDPLSQIGQTCKEPRLRIAIANDEWLIWAQLDELKEAWQKPLR